MADGASIHLYAEHLRNIRCLSIQASLKTASTHETVATLSADGNELSLTHEGETATIRLPISVPGQHNAAALHIPATPDKDLSFRLRLQEKAGSEGGLLHDARDVENVLPWTARSLTAETDIRCANCNDSIFITRGSIRVWKDLPSESWAEMMEFWHCHKPDNSDNHDHAGKARGISADSVLALKSSVGMVNPIEFLFTRQDCQNVKVVPSNDTFDHLMCSQCSAPVGIPDQETGGFRLRKPYLSLSTIEARPPVSFATEKWLSSLFMTAIDTQGVRKFVVSKKGSGESGLSIWVFTPELSVCTSSAPVVDTPLQVMKVMWKEAVVKSKGEHEKLNREVLLEGEMELYSDELSTLKALLEQSARLLPRRKNARVFQEWQIGLLQRFTSNDV